MKHFAGFLLLVAVGCGGSDANVEGNWTISVTNRDNGCNLANWTVGSQATGIGVTITQDGDAVTADIEGIVGGLVDLALGASVFSGDVDGDEITLGLFGTRGQQSGNCSFTYNATILGTVNGDTMTGRIEYSAATNNNPDCAALEACVTFQEFNGTRPPT
ncbi:MAG: hypothetical protein SFX73_24265 [Kofleriaceae bacterium]|nr:hypothetical protein [Kofleriaceae bacterium]